MIPRNQPEKRRCFHSDGLCQEMERRFTSFNKYGSWVHKAIEQWRYHHYVYGKLLEKILKRKWTDKAGHFIQLKGQVEFADFLKFVQTQGERLNNRRRNNHLYRGKNETPPFRFTAMAIHGDCGRKRGYTRSVALKCLESSGAQNLAETNFQKGLGIFPPGSGMRQKTSFTHSPDRP